MRLRAALLTLATAGLLAVTAPAYARSQTGSGGAAIVTPSLSTGPVYPKDFPDPYVIYAGGQYVAYATGSNGLQLQMLTSRDLVNWSNVSDPITLPLWAVPGYTWAPGVVQLGGKFVMYYTARYLVTQKQCIGVATSSAATGPFLDGSSKPLVCQTPGSIDPYPYIAPNGVPYLVWKSDDNSSGQRTNLWSQRLSADGLSLIGSASHLLQANSTYHFSPSWQKSIVEGPAMVQSGSSYYLFYGGGYWNTSGSGIGYAVCSSPTGPCTDQSKAGPWVGSHGAAVGPQGPSIFRDSSGQLHMAYAAWTGGAGYANHGVRSLWIDALTFNSGKPVLG